MGVVAPRGARGGGERQYRRPGARTGRGSVPAGQTAVAWKPPSTWTTSPVVDGNQSLSRATQALATAAESVTSQPSGARPSHTSSNFLKPGMLLAAMVFTGPAATRLLRMPLGPSSTAR